MSDPFTTHARKVMQLANQEAIRGQHEYIDTEHLLLGLIGVVPSVACTVLKNLNIDAAAIRREVDKIVQPGPSVVTLARVPATPRAKKVVEYALEEARHLNHDYVGSEHLLLGLLREQETVAAQILLNLGLSLEDVREEVLNLLGHAMDKPLRVDKVEAVNLPPGIAKALEALDNLFERLQEMKENAIARHDFDWAAALRDHQRDALKPMRQFLIREGHREPREPWP